MYDSILARSFSRLEQKRLRLGAIICCFIIALFFCTFFKPYLGSIPDLNLQLSMGFGLKTLAAKATKTSQRMIFKSSLRETKQKLEPVLLCDTENPRTEFCEIKSEARVDPKSSSVFVVSSPTQTKSAHGNTSSSIIIRPYARREDSAAMARVRKWSVELKPEKGLRKIPICTRNHKVPAVLFSVGGYVSNNFHDFTDVVIPLFIASTQYNREVQFLISDAENPYFVSKFRELLKGLSKYEPIDIDKEDQQVHCFPSAVIGLNRDPREMRIDPEKHSTSMKEFRTFLRKAYSLNRAKAIRIKDSLRSKKPHLLILARKKTRAFTNVGKIEEMGRSLGYKVTVTEADLNLESFSKVVNSCDVLMGVHGAGLTNIVFMPENAVLVQIVPIGGLEWFAKTDFGSPSKDMNLNYLEYKISKEESSLIEQYPLNDTVFTDPYSIYKKQGWVGLRSIFLEKQNVSLDVNRFKPTLVKALQILHEINR